MTARGSQPPKKPIKITNPENTFNIVWPAIIFANNLTERLIGLVKYENGAIGQFEVSWTFRGGLDLRDEVMGTEGTIWVNSFLRTGFEMFTTGKGGDYVAEKAESDSGWIFPVGDELNELGYNHMFADMFDNLEKGEAPAETFYDGYIVNAIIDASY